MATLFKAKGRKGYSYRIQFVDSEKRRRSIRLGGVPKRAAELIFTHVEEIILCKASGLPIPAKTSVWLCQLGDETHGKLASAGLVPQRRHAELLSYLRSYVEGRKDVKKGTIIRWNLDTKKLVEFFGENRRVDSISPKDAEKFKQSLFESGLARGTISKHLANSKMFFEAMLEEGLIHANPFVKTSVTATVDASRNVYVPRETIFKVIETAPDVDWKLIIALSRFGGLRCPSEVLSLKWECVNWSEKRILILSPKTERHPNGSQRLIPMFPELVEYLQRAWNERESGGEYVISKHRSRADVDKKDRNWGSVNLREPFLDIIRRAGLKPWKKLFHGLRASCETDLVDAGYPIQVVTAWMGHSSRIALKHYLREKQEYYDRAVRDGSRMLDFRGENHADSPTEPVQKPVQMVQKVVQQATEIDCNDSPAHEKSPQFAGSCSTLHVLESKNVPKRGRELPAKNRRFLRF